MTAIITNLKWITKQIKQNEKGYPEETWLRICGLIEELEEII